MRLLLILRRCPTEVLTSRPHNVGQHSLQSHQMRDPARHSVHRHPRQNNGVQHNKNCQSSGATLPGATINQPSQSDEQDQLGGLRALGLLGWRRKRKAQAV
jgi:hypothetical protein